MGPQRASVHQRNALLLIAALCLSAGPAPAETGGSGECVRVDRVTAFAPRGEVYVELQAACEGADFEADAPVLAYLEVLVGEQQPVGDHVRVYPDDPRARLTLVFRDLDYAVGDSILVRLLRFGRILSLQSVKAL